MVAQRRWRQGDARRTRRDGRAVVLACAAALAGLALASGDELSRTCPGGEGPFRPTAIAFGTAGELYVTDATHGSVFRLDGPHCASIADGWVRPYGVTVLGDGRVCVSHFTAPDPLTRETAVSCWDGTDWTLQVRGVGSGVNGLASTPDGIWLAAWEDTPVESRRGVLRLLAGNRVTREIWLEDGVPRFLAARPDGGLMVTVVQEDASGVTGGAVLSWSPDGRLERLDSVVDRPAGIAWSDEGAYVTDDGRGRVLLLTPDGRGLIHVRDLHGASGLAVGADGDVCVAEPGRSRIVCIPRADAREGDTP